MELAIELYANQLRGPIPSELGQLTKMEWLQLYNNILSGPVPSSFCNMASLQHIQLNGNPGISCYPQWYCVYLLKPSPLIFFQHL